MIERSVEDGWRYLSIDCCQKSFVWRGRRFPIGRVGRVIEGAQRGGDDIGGEGAEGEGGEGRGVDGSDWIGTEGGATECSGKGLRQCDSDVGHARRVRGGGR